MKNNYYLLILALVFLFIAVPRIIFPELDHGDEFSDANVLNAGENFARFGFIKMRFLPMFEPSPDTPTDLYTHYPPLPDIINGFLRVVFRTNSLRFFRFFSLLFSFLNVLFWYLFIRRLTGSGIISFLASLFFITNSLFIFGADSVHQFSYGDCLRSAIFFFTISLTGSGRRAKLFLLWFLLLLESWITFEYIAYFALFFILFNFFYRGKGNKPLLSNTTIFFLLLAPVCGFILHFLQNVWYFGSFNLAFADLKAIAVQRVVNSKELAAGALNFYSWIQLVIMRNFSLVFLFNYLFLFLGGFFSYSLYPLISRDAQKEIRLLMRFGILFSLCGITWYIIFPAHSLVHTYLTFMSRHLLPVAVMGFTIFTYSVFSFIKEYLKSSRIYFVLLFFIVVIIAFSGIQQSQLPVTAVKIKESLEFEKFKQGLLYLKQVSKNTDEIAVDYFRFPFVRYYTHRHCIPIFSKRSLENLPSLPRYFIFIPFDNRPAQELFNFLSQKYLPIYSCDSRRFPSIFFELKQ